MNYQIIPVTIFRQNCSIVWCKDTGQAALVDPGGESDKIKKRVSELGITIKKIMITHGHLDHIGASEELAKFYKIPIIGPHEADRFLMDSLPDQCRFFGLPEIRSIQSDHWLSNGETIFVGKISFTALHCPGHSPGHVVFFNKKDLFIFMGDVLFYRGIGNSSMPGGNENALIRSIRKQLIPLPKEICFLPGHGPSSSLKDEWKNNPFLKGLSL